MPSGVEARGWVQVVAQLVGLIVVASFFLARIESDAKLISASLQQLAVAVGELKSEVVTLRNYTHAIDRRLSIVEDHDQRERAARRAQ